MGRNGDDIDFDFTGDGDQIVGLKPSTHDEIKRYTSKVRQLYFNMVETAADAVNQFETVMGNASTEHANPDVLGALVDLAFKKSIKDFLGGVEKSVPGVLPIMDIVGTINDELQQAADANNSVKLRDFLINQRELVAGLRDKFDHTSIEDEAIDMFSASESEEDTVERLISFGEQLTSNADSVKFMRKFELTLWEQWIRSHFNGFREDGIGCIEVALAPDDDGIQIASVAVRMPSHSGQIVDALTRLISELENLSGPLDINVIKRIRFIDMENLVGGTQDDFGWLQESGSVAHAPFFDESKRIFAANFWKSAIHKFGKFSLS